MKIALLKHTNIKGYGWGNGYIVIPKGNIFHGKNYQQINKLIKTNKKDLSFSEMINENHLNVLSLRPGDVGKWIIGFHTCSLSDDIETWSKENVQNETEILLERLKRLSMDVFFSDSVKDVIKSYNENGNVAVLTKQIELIEDVTYQRIVVLISNKGYTLRTIKAMLSRDKDFFDKKLKESEIEIVLN